MNDDTVGTRRCQSRSHYGEQCDETATEYVTYAPSPYGEIEPETRVYCSTHADSFAEKCATDVVGRGELDDD